MKKGPAELLKTFVEFNDQEAQNDFESEWYECEVIPLGILVVIKHLLKSVNCHY